MLANKGLGLWLKALLVFGMQWVCDLMMLLPRLAKK